MKTASRRSTRKVAGIGASSARPGEFWSRRASTERPPRELAEAAGVSEALLFKHFPGKEALYSAIRKSCFKEEGSKVRHGWNRWSRIRRLWCFWFVIWFRMFWEGRLTMTARLFFRLDSSQSDR